MLGKSSFSGIENQGRFLLSEKATGVRSIFPVSFSINGTLNKDRLIDALEHLVSKREMLRSRLVLDKTGGCKVEDFGARSDTITQKELLNFGQLEQQNALKEIISNTLNFHDGRFRAILVQLEAQRYSLTLFPHHSMVDGVSLGVLLSELSRLYNSPEAELDSDEGRFELACREIENSEAGAREADIAYWSDELANLSAQPVIPSSIRQTGRSPADTGCLVDHFPPELHAKARALAHKIGVRTFSVYLGLGQIALQRLTDEPDLAVSIQSSGRRSFGVDDRLVGLFSRALVLRSPSKAKQSIADRLQDVDARVSSALAHETLPYTRIIGLSGTVPRFAFNWYPVLEGLILNGCTCQEEIIFPRPTTFDLNFRFLKRPNGLELQTYFNRINCDEISARIASRNIRHLLEAVEDNTGTRVEALPSYGAHPIGAASSDREDLGSIDALFRAQALSNLEKVAISHPAGALSYGDLLNESRRLAALVTKPASQRQRIAIIGNRTPGLAIGALAALEAGGSFTLIDPCYPDARIRSMIEIVDPDFVVVCDGLIGDIPDFPAEPGWTEVRGGVAIFGIRHVLRRASRRSAEDRPEVAYWLFTSGSTGQPKCLSTDHAPLLRSLDWQANTFGVSTEDRVSFLSGVSHDPALRDIFLPLLLGGRVCTPDPARLFEPRYLYSWLSAQHISIAHLTPAMVRLIEIGTDEGETLGSLRAVFLGGDWASPDLVDALAKRAPNARLINVYGASETPQIALFRELAKDFADRANSDRIIGRPRPDVSVQIVDRVGRICGLHEPGEIVIETAYLSNGYLQPGLQDESPFRFSNARPGQGSYRTGDRGYVTEDGEIVLIGRMDNQVKIRGFRVEPDEVSVHLQAVAGTPSAIVTARKDELGTACLVGFIERDNEMPDERSLRASLSERVPTYMVPDHLIFLDKLPFLPNGKIDRQALQSLPLPNLADRASYIAPNTPDEERMVALWQDVLGIAPIGVNDDFFSLGADSLTAVRLMLEMERAGLSEESARAILRGATIRELVQSDRGRPERATNTAAISPGPFLSRMAVHGLRGLLVVLIIAGHWFPGIIARVPALVDIHPFLTPLFNLSTPGFAIVFGISMGYFSYNTYRQRPNLFRRQISLGLAILAAALALIAVLKLLEAAFTGEQITTHLFFVSFYNVLGFYLLAVASMPLWFAWMRWTGGGIAAMVMLLFVYVALDVTMRWAFLRYEPQGLTQLLRLYATAKFSYFNMSVGAILGLAAGDIIRRRPELPSHYAFLAIGLALIAAGLFWGWLLGETEELLSANIRISYWKWSLYFGVILCLCAMFWRLISQYGFQPGWRGIPLKFLAAVGILALPFFVFHGVILDVKGVLDALTVPDVIGIALVLGLFFGLGGFAIRRIWKLYSF